MGSPLALLKHIKKLLQEEPEQIQWSKARQTTLVRGQAGLGLKIRTIQGKEESFTVVTELKAGCNISQGQLNVFDRIIAINHYEIIKDTEQKIFKILKGAGPGSVQLTVCSPRDVNLISFVHKAQPPIHVSQLEAHQAVSSTDNLLAEHTEAELEISKAINPNFSHCVNDNNNNVQLRCKSNPICKANQNGNLKSWDFSTCTNSVTWSEDRVLETNLSLDGALDGAIRNIKRGISQVSGSSSSMSGSLPLFPTPRTRAKSSKKGEGKAVKKFSKSSSTDSPEGEETEPLYIKDPKPKYKPNLSMEFSSLPVGAVDNRALSMADIIIDPDHAHSMPVDDFRPSQCPQTHCQCATCQGDSPTCNHCGGRPGSSQRSKPTSLSSPSYVELPTGQVSGEYGDFLLKNPQLAVWDSNTHVVEINKGSLKSFGFGYKVKVGKNQDAGIEYYTLVKSVEKAGPARGKLNVGDWIRSVNGTPIQSAQDAFALISNRPSLVPDLRLLIQRPVGLSQQPQLVQKEILEKSSEGKPRSPQPSFSSPADRDSDPLIPPTHIPGIIEPKTLPKPKVTTQNRYFPDSPPLHRDEHGSADSPIPRAVKLPKVRLFLCGGEAEKCANFLLKDSGLELEFKRPGYTCADCSMATDCFGNVVISAPCSNLYSTSSQPSSYTTDSCKSDGDAPCCHCGYFSSGSPLALGTVVNIEMFVVQDDRLFHNCCNYLFTKSSIFILTFDGTKLLSSVPSEFSRLQNLSHTIRSFVGEEAHVMSCGLLSQTGDTKNLMDEVRALFYTPYNSQLQNFNVCGPELINLKAHSSSEGLSDSHQLQVILWKVITETIQRQRVIHPSLLVIDHLNMVRRKDAFVKEGKLMEMIRHKLPNFQLDVHQMILTYLNMNKEILLGKAMPFIQSHHSSIESLILLNPRLLIDYLHHAISTISEDKQRWARTLSTGFIKMSLFMELLSDAGPYKQWLVDFFECCGLIFKKSTSSVDPHQQGPDLFLPYFAHLPASTLGPLAGKKDWVLYLKFADHEPSQMYWQLMLGLSRESDSPGSLAMLDVHSCSFMHSGLLVTSHHQKTEDRIKFIFIREDKSTGLQAPELLDWLWSACTKALGSVEVNFQLGAPCPYGEECRRGASQGLHLVDVRQAKVPLYCGENKIDQSKTIRMWRVRDLENISMPSGKVASSGSMSTTPPLNNLAVSSLTPPPSTMTSNWGPTSPLPKSPKPLRQPVLVMEMGFTMFNKICNKLRVHSPLGRDWQGLAGLMGYSVENVQIYETVKEPCKELIMDWSRTNNATIEDLIKLLRELEREDIVSEIQPLTVGTPDRSVSSPSCQTKVPGLVMQDSQAAGAVDAITPVEVLLKRSEGQVGTVEVVVRNVSASTQLSEEDNCVGLGHYSNNLELNRQTDTLAAGTVDTITPVETIYMRSNSVQDS